MSIKSVLKDFTLYDSDNLSGQVHKTYDYSIFRKMIGNRSLNLNHVKALKKSIQEDYIPNAIVVNQRMEVVDGQHRLQALSELNKPVYYRIIKDLDLLSVQRMNTKVRQWTMAEYLDSFCQRGFEDYIKLKEFMGMTGFCLDVCIALLLNKEVRTEPVVNEATINRKNISDDLELNSVKDSTVRAEPQDTQLKISEERLLKIRTAQSEKGLNLEFGPKDTTLKDASEQLDEANSKSQEIQDVVSDYVNCSNGN